MKTALQELISELEYIKENNCKTIQEIVFFDGVLAIIESKYLEKEKVQLIQSYNQDLYGCMSGCRKFEDGDDYYNETFNK